MPLFFGNIAVYL